jgi:hypothetical protein
MNKESYITIYQPIGGWNSVLMVFDEEIHAHVPYQTGTNNTLGNGSKESALAEAKMWAESEDIPYRDHIKDTVI